MKNILICIFISLYGYSFTANAQSEEGLSQNFLERFYKVTQQPLPVIPLEDLTNSGDYSASMAIEAGQLIIGDQISLDLSKSTLSLSQIKVDAKNSNSGLLVDYASDLSNEQGESLNKAFSKTRLFIPTKQAHELFVGFLSKDNELVSNKGGYAIVVYEFDALRRVTSERYLSVDMKPVLSNRLFHQKKYQFKGDNLMSVAYLGINGEPVEIRSGSAKTLYSYDENDQLIEMITLDAKGLKVGVCNFNHADGLNLNVSFDSAIELEDNVVIKLLTGQ